MNLLLLLISLSAAVPVLPGESLIQSEEKLARQLGNLHIIKNEGIAKIVGIDSLRSGDSHIINIKTDFSPLDFNRLLLKNEANFKFLLQDPAFREYLKSEKFREFIIKNPKLLENHNPQEIGALGKLIGYETVLKAYPPLFIILLDDPEFLKYARSKEFAHTFLDGDKILYLMRDSGASHLDIVKLYKPEPANWVQRARARIALGWK